MAGAETPAASERITKALTIAAEDGMYDGDHHKMWVIDQMVRALTGCPVVQVTKNDAHGKPYTFEAQGESAEYQAFVATGDWDEGIAP